MIYRANSLGILLLGADFSPCTFGNQSFSSLESEIWRDIFEHLMLSLPVASPWSGKWRQGQMVLLWMLRGGEEKSLFLHICYLGEHLRQLSRSLTNWVWLHFCIASFDQLQKG